MARAFSRRSLLRAAGWGAAAAARAAARLRLLVVSIDGLDHRYLRDSDKLGLRIPNLRRLRDEGRWAGGVVGVHPTVTWPSHTTIVTGVTPERHGILSNNRPAAEGGERYWFTSLLKAPPLWDAAAQAGLKTAAIHWPVTVGARIDWNLPEYFRRRQGGGMDMDSTDEKATAGLVARISRAYPSFPQEWVDDRVRALATIYLLQHEKPDLTLLHFIDHDDAAHQHGPFTTRANAVLELTDELLGLILGARPEGTVVAIVSDHGFERVDKVVNLWAAQRKRGQGGEIASFGTLAAAKDAGAAELLRTLSAAGEAGVGREIPSEEVQRFAPTTLRSYTALFEPLPHFQFARYREAPEETVPKGRGDHGYWPGRADYRATFLLWGESIRRGGTPEVPMTSLAGELAAILDLRFPAH